MANVRKNLKAMEEMREISREKVRYAMGRMKSVTALGPESILVEAWRTCGELAVTWLTRLFN